MDIHFPEKLYLDMLMCVRYKSTNWDTYVYNDDQMHVGLFGDLGLLFDEGK